MMSTTPLKPTEMQGHRFNRTPQKDVLATINPELIYDDEDRLRLQNLSEIERQAVLAERYEHLNNRQEKQKLEHLLAFSQKETGGSFAFKNQTSDIYTTEIPQRRKQEPRPRIRGDSSGPFIDQGYPSSNRDSLGIHATLKSTSDSYQLEFEHRDFLAAFVTRRDIEKLLTRADFDSAVRELFCRINFFEGEHSSYKIGRIQSITDGKTPYATTPHLGPKSPQTTKLARIQFSHTLEMKDYKFSFFSNQAPTMAEVIQWAKEWETNRPGESLPTAAELERSSRRRSVSAPTANRMGQNRPQGQRRSQPQSRGELVKRSSELRAQIQAAKDRNSEQDSVFVSKLQKELAEVLRKLDVASTQEGKDPSHATTSALTPQLEIKMKETLTSINPFRAQETEKEIRGRRQDDAKNNPFGKAAFQRINSSARDLFDRAKIISDKEEQTPDSEQPNPDNEPSTGSNVDIEGLFGSEDDEEAVIPTKRDEPDDEQVLNDGKTVRLVESPFLPPVVGALYVTEDDEEDRNSPSESTTMDFDISALLRSAEEDETDTKVERNFNPSPSLAFLVDQPSAKSSSHRSSRSGHSHRH